VTPSSLFSAWAGSRSPRVLFVGEAWGESEDLHRVPFVGHSGKELFRMFGDAGIAPGAGYASAKRVIYASDEAFLAAREAWLRANGIALTNVFNLRPQGNKLEALCGPEGKGVVFGGRVLPPLVRSPKHLYMRGEFAGHLARLGAEVASARPALVVALGTAALWGLVAALRTAPPAGTHTEIRGTVHPGPPKFLATFHPSYILRQWSARSVAVADLIKSWRESATREFRRPERTVLISPELADIREWYFRHVVNAQALSCDIETKGGQITSIGFASSPRNAIVVPFVLVGEDPPTFRSYWRTAEDELAARREVRRFLQSPAEKVFQNGLYDIQWLLRDGYAIRACGEDTMLLHHAIHPEMRKGLGFLGSIYTDEPAWKLMRKRGSDESVKAEE